MSLVREVVERYDVDGIHFDYLRYPENRPPVFPTATTTANTAKDAALPNGAETT